MEDERFKQIMKEYVAVSSKGAAFDLKKRNEEGPSPIGNRSAQKRYLLKISCLLLAILSLFLAIVLPVTIPQKKDAPIYYADSDNEAYYTFLGEDPEILRDYDVTLPLPTIEGLFSTDVLMVHNKNHERYGFMVSIGTYYNEDLILIETGYILETVQLDHYKPYDDLTLELNWQERTVFYKVLRQETWNSGVLYRFNENGYNFYLSVTCDPDLDPVELLNLIFG